MSEVFRLARVVSYIAAYASRSVAKKILIKDPTARRQFFIRNISVYSKKALDAIQFKIEVKGLENLMGAENHLFVCNHMSYLDILTMSSIRPFVYVTSVDMGEVPFLGDMAEMGGSLFIERRNRSQIGQDIRQIGEVLRQGFDVMLFPEGTSSNGQDVLPFKRSMFMSAIEEKKKVIPTVICYKKINGEAFSTQNCDHVAWYGKMSFLPHFLGLMKLKSVEVEVRFLEPINTNVVSDKHELAERSQKQIRDTYLPMISS